MSAALQLTAPLSAARRSVLQKRVRWIVAATIT